MGKVKLIILTSLIFSALLVNSEPVNMNTDPLGEPWWAGSLRPLTLRDRIILSSLERLSLPQDYRNRPIPDHIDNSLLQYFRPVFSQEGGSCGQASGVGYNFTYEIDLERDLPADNSLNQYPTHFTWNFLNGGEDSGSWYWDGWEIIRKNGCPNVVEYGGMAYGGFRRWMNGYGNYHAGMDNRILEYYAIDVSTEEGLTVLKHWMNDHLDGTSFGGLANFAAGVSNYTMDFLPEGSPEAGSSVILNWSYPVNHALTFVGYNDSIRWDYNGDRLYTNDIDINHDGIVNLQDWEIGGLIVVNSWGTGWGDSGKAFMMYKLLAEPTDEGGIWNNIVHVIRAKDQYQPLLTLKAIIEHDSRNKLKIYAGMSNDLQAQEPDQFWNFPLFDFQGGPYFMQGGEQEYHKQIEIGLDITPLLSNVIQGDPAKFFLIVENEDPDNIGAGQIISYSLIDYTNGEEEVAGEENNVAIINNEITTVSLLHTISYDAVNILTEELPPADPGEEFSYQLEAEGGCLPYTWGLKTEYDVNDGIETVEFENGIEITPTNLDNGSTQVELDFDFPFYEQTFDSFSVTSDGSVTFSDGFSFIRDDYDLINSRAITPYGANLVLNSSEGEGIWFYGGPENAVVRWKASRQGFLWTDLEFALRIDAEGTIDFFYIADNSNMGNWISGISLGDNINYQINEISGSNNIPDDFHLIYTKPDFPEGISLSESGMLSGTVLENDGFWDITFLVKDTNDIHALKTIPFEVNQTGENDLQISGTWQLSQNYPNPFILGTSSTRNETCISFSIPGIDDAELKIYNIKGELVKKINVDLLAARTDQEISWNGHDQKGVPVPSGVYIYNLKSGNKELTRKMVLIRQ